MLKPMIGAFMGRVAAVLFLAVCVALGIGPDRWAKLILGSNPEIWARFGFVFLGLLAFVGALIRPLRWRVESAHLHSPLTLPPMTVTEIAEYLRDESDWGWRAYERLNFKQFVQDAVPAEMRRAAKAGEVRFTGAPPNSVKTEAIDPTYWEHAWFDENRIWDKRNSYFTWLQSVSTSIPEIRKYQFGKAPRADVMAQWPKATFVRKGFSLAFVAIKRFWFRLKAKLLCS